MKQLLKIFIIGSAHPLRGGGISTFNERLAQEITESTYDTTIISFTYQYPNFLFPGKNQFTEEPAPQGIKIKSLINSINPLNWWKVGRYIKKEKPDLIIVRYWLPFMGAAFGTILRIAKRNKHTEIIAITDNIIPHEKRIGDTILTKYFIKPVDAFISMSRDVLNDLKKFDTVKPTAYSPHPMYDNYGEKVSRNEALEFLNLSPNKKYILFFGFIRKYKGLDLLLEAMSDESMMNSDIELIIAGEYYGDAEFYQGLIQSLDIKNKVHEFTAFIPNNEVKYYFSVADIVVQPYKSATQSGISQIAYHFEVPMVVTNVGGLPEIVPNNKVGKVVEMNAKAIADAILDIYSSNKLTQYKKGINEEKKKYTWDTFVENILSLYQSINK